MPTLVSPTQTTFVSGRRGTDNVIVAQELVYTLEKKKGKAGFMVIKLDLEKAYDRAGFHEDTIELVMSFMKTR